MNRILVVEDSAEAQVLLRCALAASYFVDFVDTKRAAVQILEHKKFDLLVLDIILPDGDGVEVCEALRRSTSNTNIPVIFLTVRDSLDEKIRALNAGGDDYLVKPLDLLEIRARVDAKFRRLSQERKADNDIYVLGDIKFDKTFLRASIIEEGGRENDLMLTPIEFKILYYLAKNQNQIRSRFDLLNSVWSENVTVIQENIYTHISAIRKKLAHRRHYIQCLPRVGYKFSVSEDVEQV